MSATLFDATVGSTTIKQCSAVGFSPNNQIEVQRASAAVAPSQFSVMSGEPRGRFTSTDLATLLAALDEVGGLYVSSGSLVIPWRVRSPGGSFVSGGNNFSLTGTKGLLIPISLTANQGQLATLECEVVLLSTDGFTHPVTYVGSVSLSAPSFVGTYRLGPTVLNESPVTGITGFTVQFGSNLDLERYDGGPFPQNVYVTESNPMIQLRFRSHALLNTYGPLFQVSAGGVLSLVQNIDGGIVDDLTNSSHITCTFDGGISDVQDVSGQGSAISEPTLQFMPKAITMATGVALAE